MKIKFFAIFIMIALLFAACGGNQENPQTQGTQETSGNTGSNETTVPEAPQETEGDGVIAYTTPDGGYVLILPEDEFGDDVEGIFSSRPLDSDVPDASEPVITDPPATENPNAYRDPDILPEDVFED